jgi:uncharacterized protein YceK
MNMKNIVSLALCIFVLSGCTSISKFIPSDFDNVEYGKLVELNVISAMGEDGLWCMKPILSQMDYRTHWLYTYSKYRLNDNITTVYQKLNSLTDELVARENPSDAYCRLKRQNIHKVTTQSLEVFGGRK